MQKQEAAQHTTQEIFQLFGTSEKGLSIQAARTLLQKFGPNTFKRDTNSALQIFMRQIRSPLVYLFALAAVLSFFLQDLSDGTIITVILILNALLGFFQEYRSEKAVEKLSQFISKQILVTRDGKTELLDEKFLVPGDIVTIREGDIVPADLKVFESENLSANESQLTGESVPLAKTPASLLFAGSTIEKGDGKGIVYATGNATELGKIAHLSATTKKITQYEKSLHNFSSYLTRVVLVTLALIFVGKLLATHDLTHISALFLFVVALAVTVIPEALPVIAIVTLSQGALKLAKKSVVVKRLSALEDLGNITLLCTDKTGTLTENTLTAQNAVASDVVFFQKLAYASIEDLGIKKKKFTNSYDQAFQSYVPKEIQEQVKAWKQISELSFDPAARRRRIVLEDPYTKKYYLVEIGSVETLLHIAKCEKKAAYLHAVVEDGKRGIRHLAIAYKELTKEDATDHLDILKHENNLLFLGYVQLIDPLRPSAKHAIDLAEKLGVEIKILTGDSKEVAEYVGRQVGLLKNTNAVYSGDEVEKMSEDELKNAVRTCNVFARVTPEQKYSIIQHLKNSYVVGYQGDGINDAPSLKLADVAIAVNTATDVAKDSADIVLLKNDLAVIINGIHYGRSIFVNINKYIKHTMVGNFGAFFSLAILYLVAFDLPQLPIQLLLGNLIQDIPLVTIYSDTVDDDEVLRPEHYNIHSIMFISLFLGGFTAIYNFIYFTFAGLKSTPFTQTSLFLFFNFTTLIIILSIRNKKHMWQGKRPSLLLIVSIIFFALLSLAITYIPPLAALFSFVPISPMRLGFIIGAAVVYIFALDYIKIFYYKMMHRGDGVNQKTEESI